MREHKLEKILKALANRRRLKIVARLKRKGKMTVGRIAGEIRLSFAATSRHLVILERSGILEKEQWGLEVFYQLAKKSRPFVKALRAEL